MAPGNSADKALLLAGGLGMRLRAAVPDLPKVLAPVRGKPALAWQMELLAAQGVRDFVLAVGYRAALVEAEFGDGRARGWSVRYAREREGRLLGTAGAIRNALRQIPDLGERAFWVFNGDTYVNARLDGMEAVHRAGGFAATVGVGRVGSTGARGRIERRGDRVVAFDEKPGEDRAGWVNAGAYLLEPRVADCIAPGARVSLEREVLPRLIREEGGVGACEVAGEFFDMGTPAGLDALAAHLGGTR